MTLSFKDRLNRIADSQTVDARAQTKVDVSPQTGSVLNPTHAGPNTRTFVISYCLVGILWMYPTGWILGNYDIIHALLLRRPDVTQDATQSALIIWISAMLSMLLFFAYFRSVYPQFSAHQRRLGPPLCLCQRANRVGSGLWAASHADRTYGRQVGKIRALRIGMNKIRDPSFFGAHLPKPLALTSNLIYADPMMTRATDMIRRRR